MRLVTDAAAQIVNRYEFDSYGKRLVAVEGVDQPYSWKGREWLAGPDVYYNRARFYDPKLGSFISEDPMGYASGDYNLFAFTWSNPKNWSDPSGLSAYVEYGGVSNAGVAGTTSGGRLAAAAEFATRVSTAASLRTGGLASVSQIAGRLSCTFYVLADAFAVANDPTVENLAELVVDSVNCGVKLNFKKPKPKPAPQTCPYVPGKNSFDGDTLVWIQDGLKAIRDIREGDQVLAWDPITNAPTLKPVLGTSSRMTDDVYRLTLADAGGKPSECDTHPNPPVFCTNHKPVTPTQVGAHESFNGLSIANKEPCAPLANQLRLSICGLSRGPRPASG